MRRFVVFSLLCLLVLVGISFFTTAVQAQVTNVTNIEATPTPGVGHDYMHELSETVNPANGSLSVRIQVPVPTGRRLTLPFAFAYDTSGQYLPFADARGSMSWGKNNQFITLGGWTYSVPTVTFITAQVAGFVNGFNVYCPYSTGFIFTDSNGMRHALGLAVWNNVPICQQMSNAPINYLTGSDGIVSAKTTLGSGQPVTVTDADGTTYTFSTFRSSPGSGVPVALPASVEDRNGNLLTYTSQSNGAFTFTDTVGRTAISSSAFGVNGNTVSVSGLSNNFTVSWATGTSGSYNPGAVGLGQPQNCATGPWPNISVGGTTITNIQQPNGQSYKFFYDSGSGFLKQIIYPNGGWVKYTWQQNPLSEMAYLTFLTGEGGGGNPNNCPYHFGLPAVKTRQVSYDGSTVAEQQDFAYSTTWSTTDVTVWTTKSTTVTTHDYVRGSGTFQTTYTYTPLLIGPPPNVVYTIATQVPVESQIVYKDWNGNVLQTVNKTWYNPYRLKSQQTVLPNSQASQVTYTYGNLGVVTETDEYDFGQTSPSRKTITNYQPFPLNPLGSAIYDRPCQTLVYDGGGTRYAETDYFYDNGGTGTVCATAGTPSVTGLSNLTKHDETNYGASSTAPRGNVTTKTQKCFIGSTTCADSVTTYTYDETGQMLRMTDPCGNGSCSDMTGTTHTTFYSYADSYTVLSGGQNVAYGPSGTTDAFVTTITDALGHTQNFSYDFNNGQLTILKDQNSQTTTVLYNDPFARPTQANYPDLGLTQYFYSDLVGNVNVEKKKSIDGTRTTDEFSYYDGLGHQISHSTANGESIPWDKTDTCFDGLGQVMFASYPYQATNAIPGGGCPSEAGDSFVYDSLARITSVKHSDNNVISTTYTGRATDVLDEGNGTHRIEKVSQVDGLGRLVSVCEVTTSTQLGPGGTPATCPGQDIAKTGFITTYGYDVLGNLLTVSQGALAQRSFTYDSLLRLLTATNPESGTTCNGTWSNNQCVNGYDANSNLTYRTRPAPNQTNPATTVRTTYQYDPLNRVTQRTYSDGMTPAATFVYDQTGTITIAGQSFPISYSIGHLTSNCTGPTTSCLTQFAFSYDSMGRVNQQEEFISGWSGASELTYTYDLLGNETGDIALGNNSTYNVAGRLTTFTHPNYNGPGEPANLLIGGHYDAYGHLTSATFGDGLSQSWAYDTRGRVQSAAVGTNCSGGSCSGSTVYRYTVGYAPNSDVTSSTDTVNGTWTYTQDDLNRLASSACTANCPNNSSSQSFTYKYDRYSNRWQQNAPQGGPQPLFTFSGNNNRVDGLSYDAAGNLRNDGNHGYTYDAENRIVSVDNGATTYLYDAGGRRVQQKIGSQTCSHYYDQKGRVVIRTDATCATYQRYAYVGNTLLGTYTNYAANQNIAPFFYAHGDWVGTERARVDSTTGAACQTVVSLPFGDGQTVKGTCGTVTSDMDFHHFTGKERDSESNLDMFGARYYGSSLGRFMTPDWAEKPTNVPYADFGNPQSLNLYSYVKNNPLTLTDPDGHCWGWAEKLCNFWNYGAWVNNAQLQTMISDRRQWLQTNFVQGGGFTNKDVPSLTDQQVWTLYNNSQLQITTGTARTTDQNGNPITGLAGSLPWGSWADYPKVSVGGTEYAKIGDRLYTEHAVERMTPRGLTTNGRSISPEFVEEVITKGAQRPEVVNGVNRIVHSLGSVEVVTENGGKLVVTVITK
jgi:RHS repeat-associated protein